MTHKEKGKAIMDLLSELLPAVKEMQEIKKIRSEQSSLRNEIDNLLHKMLFYSQKIKKPKLYSVTPNKYYDNEIRLSDTYGLRYKHRQHRMDLIGIKIDKHENGNVFVYHIDRDYHGNDVSHRGIVLEAKDFKPEMLSNWCDLVNEVNEKLYPKNVKYTQGAIIRCEDKEGKEYLYEITSHGIVISNKEAEQVLSYWMRDISTPFQFLSGEIGNIRYGSEGKEQSMAYYLSYIDTFMENIETIRQSLIELGEAERALKDKIETAIAPQLLLEEIKGRKQADY